MALFRRLDSLRPLYQTFHVGQTSYLLKSSRSYCGGSSNGLSLSSWRTSPCSYNGQTAHSWTCGNTVTIRSAMAIKLSIFLNDKRSASTQIKAPPQARQMGAFKVALSSPGFIYEPYGPREKISFWRRWFTRSGWGRTKEDVVLELKSAYALSRLRKSGYSKHKFYKEAVELYKEINTLIANGQKTVIRKAVTEKMFSEIKNEIKQREARWHRIYWEMLEPVVKIRTLRARMIALDKTNLDKSFMQLTLEILSKQKFEAYDSKGTVVAGDKNKEVLVRDIWVFEKSLFHPGAYWRLCGRISL